MGYYHINGDPYPCTGVCNVTGYANQPVNNMCVECRLPFCTKCTLYGECLACNQGFLVVNGTCYCPPTINGKTAVLYFYICIPCEYFYGPECTACDTDNCLNCSSSKYSLDNYDFLTYATCVLCSKYDP